MFKPVEIEDSHIELDNNTINCCNRDDMSGSSSDCGSTQMPINTLF